MITAQELHKLEALRRGVLFCGHIQEATMPVVIRIPVIGRVIEWLRRKLRNWKGE